MYLFLGRLLLTYIAIVCCAKDTMPRDLMIVDRLPNYKPSNIGQYSSSLPEIAATTSYLHAGRAPTGANYSNHYHHCKHTAAWYLRAAVFIDSGCCRDLNRLDCRMRLQLGVDTGDFHWPCRHCLLVCHYNTFTCQEIRGSSKHGKRSCRCSE